MPIANCFLSRERPGGPDPGELVQRWVITSIVEPGLVVEAGETQRW